MSAVERIGCIAAAAGIAGCANLLGIDDVSQWDGGGDSGAVLDGTSSGSPHDATSMNPDADGVDVQPDAPTADAGTGADGTTTDVSTGGDGPATDACTGGACSCPPDMPLYCNDACTDPQTDTANCGGCGHDCQGGACNQGVCAPVALATQMPAPQQLAVDPANVYWSYSDSMSARVRECAIAGCGMSPTELPNVIWTYQFAVSDPNIFWNSEDYAGILMCPIDNCTGPQGVAMHAAPGIAVGPAGWVYWIDLTGGELKGCDSSNCSSPHQYTNLGQGHQASAPIASNGGAVFVVDHDLSGGGFQIMQCPAAAGGGQCFTFFAGTFDASATQITSLATDATKVYWSIASQGSVWACNIGAPCATPTVLGENRQGNLEVAVDGTNVYWTESSAIVSCARGGCNGQPKTVIAGLSHPAELAVDGKNLYWYNPSDSTIVRLAKP